MSKSHSKKLDGALPAKIFHSSTIPTIHDVINPTSYQIHKGDIGINSTAHANRLVTLWDAKHHCDQFDTFIFDFNGVIASHGPFPFSGPSINRLLEMNKKVIIASNNSHAPRSLFQKILKSIGVDLPMDNIFTAMSGAALHASNNNYKNVITIGNDAIEEECHHYKINTFPFVTYYADFATSESTQEFITKHHIDAIIRTHSSSLGALPDFQTRIPCDPTYRVLTHSNLPIITCEDIPTCYDYHAYANRSRPQNPSAHKCATGHCDTGLEVLKRSGVEAAKPAPLLYQAIKSIHKDIKDETTVMIGDTLANDMAFAHNSKIQSALVLTGSTSIEQFTAEYLPSSCAGLKLKRELQHLVSQPTGRYQWTPTFVAVSINELPIPSKPDGDESNI